MNLPFELKQKNVALPPAMADDIQERARKLDRFFDRIMRCRITVEGPGTHHRQGVYGVTIDLTVPGTEFVIHKQESENLEKALTGAFHAAGRRLESHGQKRNGHGKGRKSR